MLFQTILDLWKIIADAIGAFIATLFAILTWYWIEYIKKSIKEKKVKKNIVKLFKTLSREIDSETVYADLINLLGFEIESKDILKILKMNSEPLYQRDFKGVKLTSNLFSLRVHYGMIGSDILIEEPVNNYYSYRKPNEKIEIKERFLQHIKERCKEADIKLDS